MERLSPVTITTGSHNAEQLHPLSHLGKRYLQVGLGALWWQRSPRQQRESVLVESCRPGWNIIMPSSAGILLCRPRQDSGHTCPPSMDKSNRIDGCPTIMAGRCVYDAITVRRKMFTARGQTSLSMCVLVKPGRYRRYDRHQHATSCKCLQNHPRVRSPTAG